MRVLFLTKRQYTNKDLIDDQYGRLWELTLGLSKLGHEVVGLCLSYARRDRGWATDIDNPESVPWYSLNTGRCRFCGFLRYFILALWYSWRFRPEVIIGASDSIYAIVSIAISRLVNAKCVVDLYDNFESFSTIEIPGVRILYQRTLRHTDAIVCVSNELAEMVRSRYCPKGIVTVIPNAVRKDVFFPRDKRACREQLGLPQDAVVIGTAGALSHSRDISVLFTAFTRLAEEYPILYLALAGPRDRDVNIPDHPRVRYLGVLDHERVPLLLCALDIAIICNRDSDFGRYCFPQKAYEMLACGTPLVVAEVGAMRELFKDYSYVFYQVGSPASLGDAIRLQIQQPIRTSIPVPEWSELARNLHRLLLSLKGH